MTAVKQLCELLVQYDQVPYELKDSPDIKLLESVKRLHDDTLATTEACRLPPVVEDVRILAGKRQQAIRLGEELLSMGSVAVAAGALQQAALVLASTPDEANVAAHAFALKRAYAALSLLSLAFACLKCLLATATATPPHPASSSPRTPKVLGDGANGDGSTGARAVRGKVANGKATNGKATNGKATNGKATNGKATNGKSPSASVVDAGELSCAGHGVAGWLLEQLTQPALATAVADVALTGSGLLARRRERGPGGPGPTAAPGQPAIAVAAASGANDGTRPAADGCGLADDDADLLVLGVLVKASSFAYDLAWCSFRAHAAEAARNAATAAAAAASPVAAAPVSRGAPTKPLTSAAAGAASLPPSLPAAACRIAEALEQSQLLEVLCGALLALQPPPAPRPQDLDTPRSQPRPAAPGSPTSSQENHGTLPTADQQGLPVGKTAHALASGAPGLPGLPPQPQQQLRLFVFNLANCLNHLPTLALALVAPLRTKGATSPASLGKQPSARSRLPPAPAVFVAQRLARLLLGQSVLPLQRCLLEAFVLWQQQHQQQGRPLAPGGHRGPGSGRSCGCPALDVLPLQLEEPGGGLGVGCGAHVGYAGDIQYEYDIVRLTLLQPALSGWSAVELLGMGVEGDVRGWGRDTCGRGDGRGGVGGQGGQSGRHASGGWSEGTPTGLAFMFDDAARALAALSGSGSSCEGSATEESLAPAQRTSGLQAGPLLRRAGLPSVVAAAACTALRRLSRGSARAVMPAAVELLAAAMAVAVQEAEEGRRLATAQPPRVTPPSTEHGNGAVAASPVAATKEKPKPRSRSGRGAPAVAGVAGASAEVAAAMVAAAAVVDTPASWIGPVDSLAADLLAVVTDEDTGLASLSPLQRCDLVRRLLGARWLDTIELMVQLGGAAAAAAAPTAAPATVLVPSAPSGTAAPSMPPAPSDVEAAADQVPGTRCLALVLHMLELLPPGDLLLSVARAQAPAGSSISDAAGGEVKRCGCATADCAGCSAAAEVPDGCLEPGDVVVGNGHRQGPDRGLSTEGEDGVLPSHPSLQLQLRRDLAGLMVSLGRLAAQMGDRIGRLAAANARHPALAAAATGKAPGAHRPAHSTGNGTAAEREGPKAQPAAAPASAASAAVTPSAATLNASSQLQDALTSFDALIVALDAALGSFFRPAEDPTAAAAAAADLPCLAALQLLGVNVSLSSSGGLVTGSGGGQQRIPAAEDVGPELRKALALCLQSACCGVVARLEAELNITPGSAASPAAAYTPGGPPSAPASASALEEGLLAAATGAALCAGWLASPLAEWLAATAPDPRVALEAARAEQLMAAGCRLLRRCGGSAGAGDLLDGATEADGCCGGQGDAVVMVPEPSGLLRSCAMAIVEAVLCLASQQGFAGAVCDWLAPPGGTQAAGQEAVGGAGGASQGGGVENTGFGLNDVAKDFTIAARAAGARDTGSSSSRGAAATATAAIEYTGLEPAARAAAAAPPRLRTELAALASLTEEESSPLGPTEAGLLRRLLQAAAEAGSHPRDVAAGGTATTAWWLVAPALGARGEGGSGKVTEPWRGGESAGSGAGGGLGGGCVRGSWLRRQAAVLLAELRRLANEGGEDEGGAEQCLAD